MPRPRQKEHGQTVNRSEWRLSVPVHLAESREEAFEQVRLGAGRVVTEYTGATNGHPTPPVPANEIVDYMVDNGQWIVGTPDDAIAAIERLQESSGGFGGLLARAEDWTTRENLFHSYELFARYVMPRFQGSLTGIVESNSRFSAMREALQGNRRAGLQRATDTYLARSQ